MRIVGRSLAALVLALMAGTGPVHGVESGTRQCDRDAFGRFSQKDLKDTRARVLEDRAAGPYAFRDGSGGRQIMAFGTWRDAFTGDVLRNVPAQLVEIDHVIPVCWAWDRGAAQWSYDKRRRFLNDTRYLQVVRSGFNRAKRDMGPDEFLPPSRPHACAYVRLFQDGVRTYDLRLTDAEQVLLTGIETATCGTAVTSVAPPGPFPRLADVPAVSATVFPAFSVAANAGRCHPNYAGVCVPVAADVDCAGGSGNGPAYVQGPVRVIKADVYDLDSNGDGIGCASD